MNLKLEIRRNADGVVVTDLWPDWDFNVFWWKEGNASCDCNRGEFFNSAHGDSDSESECGEGRYSVRLSDADTGVLLYDDFRHMAKVEERGGVEAPGSNSV